MHVGHIACALSETTVSLNDDYLTIEHEPANQQAKIQHEVLK